MVTQRDPYPARLFWLIALSLAGWAFWKLSAILLPIVLGAFIAFALWPIVRILPAKWPRWIRSVCALLTALALIVGFLLLLVPSLLAQAQQIAAKFPEYLQAISGLGVTGEAFLKRYGINYNLAAHQAEIAQRLQEAGLSVVGWVGGSLSGLAGNLLQLVIVFWTVLYGLLEGPEIIQWLNDQLPMSVRENFRETRMITGKVLHSFLKGIMILGAIIGIAVGIGAWAIGMPYALSIGLVAAAMEAVPNLGPIIAATFAGILALAQSPLLALKIVALFTVVQVLENNLIVPKVLGDSLEVHPMVIFFAVLIGAELFGLPGLFLAGPAVAVGWRIWTAHHPAVEDVSPMPPVPTERPPEA